MLAAGPAAAGGAAPAAGAPLVPPKAPIPEFSFGVWNATDGTVCILAKFQVFFTITYAGRGGLQVCGEPISANCAQAQSQKPGTPTGV